MLKHLSPLRLILLLLFCPAFSFAQLGQPRSAISLGVNAGFAMNKMSFDPSIKQNWHFGPTVGFSARFTSEMYFKTLCALQVELNYMQAGWRENVLSSAGLELPDTYRRDMHYLQLPMLARLAWGNETTGKGGRPGLMGFIVAGPQVGFLIGEKEHYGQTWTTLDDGTPDRPGGMSSQYGLKADRKFEYGIAAGGGLELHTRSGDFLLEGRYYYGLSDVFKNGKTDVFARSASGTIVVKMTYLFSLR